MGRGRHTAHHQAVGHVLQRGIVLIGQQADHVHLVAGDVGEDEAVPCALVGGQDTDGAVGLHGTEGDFGGLGVGQLPVGEEPNSSL